MYISADSKKHNWEEFTLIVPAISVGNVGQLTADLIISTLWMERVGYIYHDSILPIVGNNPFAHKDATSCKLTTSCEVFESISNQIVVIQQRSPFVRGKRADFVKWLCEWIEGQKFHQVAILTSTHAHERIDIQLQGSQFRYVASPLLEKRYPDLSQGSLKWQKLEKRLAFPAPSPHDLDHSQSENLGVLYMPGSGIAKQLYEQCCDKIAIAVLMLFCSEGDNGADAVTLANHLNSWLNLVDFKKNEAAQTKGITEWKVPLSWRLVHGSGFDQTLFH